MRWDKLHDALTVYLSGEIDHYSAGMIRDEIEQRLSDRNVQTLILDFSSVTFMDSSGIGMIIGRYKTMTERGGMLRARGLHPPVDALFHMAGLHRIIAEDAERKA